MFLVELDREVLKDHAGRNVAGGICAPERAVADRQSGRGLEHPGPARALDSDVAAELLEELDYLRVALAQSSVALFLRIVPVHMPLPHKTYRKERRVLTRRRAAWTSAAVLVHADA